MERNIPLITDYTGILDSEKRRQAIADSKKEQIASGRIQRPETQHNYSGDPIFVQLDEDGNWESDYFEITK
ncbi:MAG TPA: hypothetical protein PLD54_00655 [Candidatus Levybacteria bacterium]|nr:hypothetical protein [Candidatus Levybacteria bacterium]